MLFDVPCYQRVDTLSSPDVVFNQLTFFNKLIRPVATHSATKMFPALSKQASCGWMNRPAFHVSGCLRIFILRTSFVQLAS